MMNSPTRLAFSMYLLSSKCKVASEAAMHTGFPPNVEACAPGFVHHALTRNDRAQWHPGCNALRRADYVRLNPWRMVHRPPLPSAAHSRLYFVGYQHDSVLSANLLQTLQKLRWRQNVAALTFDRLDKNPRDLHHHAGVQAVADAHAAAVVDAHSRGTSDRAGAVRLRGAGADEPVLLSGRCAASLGRVTRQVTCSPWQMTPGIATRYDVCCITQADSPAHPPACWFPRLEGRGSIDLHERLGTVKERAS